MKRKFKDKHGFTLVELSIVLVVIGLLIGGILVGQSLIDSAKINSQVLQIQQFDIAVSNFKGKFKSIPGDSRFMTNPGDGNGNIQDNNLYFLNYNQASSFTREVANFWRHLSIYGFMPDKIIYSDTPSPSIAAGINTPEAKIGETLYSAKKPSIVVGNSKANVPYYLFADFTASASNYYCYPGSCFAAAFTPMEVLAIDTKMDDGLASYGIVDNSGFSGNVTGFKYPSPGNGQQCYSGAAYKTNSNIECMLAVRLLGSQGNQ